MITYVCLGTNDLARASLFYDAALATLGYGRYDMSHESGCDVWLGWGTPAQLALSICSPFDGRSATVGNGTMVALGAKSWKQVDQFYAASLAHGGISEGEPGLRLQYSPDFYAAYVRDPDGNKLAAVCRGFTELAPIGI